jgi:hypothetical protein
MAEIDYKPIRQQFRAYLHLHWRDSSPNFRISLFYTPFCTELGITPSEELNHKLRLTGQSFIQSMKIKGKAQYEGKNKWLILTNTTNWGVLFLQFAKQHWETNPYFYSPDNLLRAFCKAQQLNYKEYKSKIQYYRNLFTKELKDSGKIVRFSSSTYEIVHQIKPEGETRRLATQTSTV